jgi:hypothetical protein
MKHCVRKNVESIPKIKIESVCPCEHTKVVTKSRKVTKMVTADLDFIRPCWKGFNLDYK